MARRGWGVFDLPIALVAFAVGCGSQTEGLVGHSGAGGTATGASGGEADTVQGGGGSSGAAGANVGGSQDSAECPSPPSAPAAGDVLEGDITLASASDAEEASALSVITGSLVITASFPGVLNLPNLQQVGGDVHLEGHAVAGAPETDWASITELRLPNLQSIGGELFVYLTGALVETDFRSLETVGYRVYYMRNLALRRIGLDSITTGPVDIQASPLAASCEIDAICTRIGSMGCGSQYSDPDCTCVERCGRDEPRCGD